MNPRAYYNENEPFAARWLRNLIAAGHIMDGEVDDRSIEDVKADDFRGFVQCHFFAGIGVWSHALRCAGWPDERPIWTGSCPCQPFSVAGSRKGTADERHLWPVWFRLIGECRPAIVVGEQVCSPQVIGDEGERFRVSAEIPEKAQGQGSGQACSTKSPEEAIGLRPVGSLGRDPGADIKGFLRGNWSSVEPRWRSHLGQSLAGQDCPICGIRVQEHQDRLPCGEWSDGRLGRTEGDRHGDRNFGEAQAGVKRLVDALGRNLAEASGGAWLDLVQADLESAGYVCGSCVLAAAGVGAPHIRQRLYWVGHSCESGSRRDTGHLDQCGQVGDICLSCGKNWDDCGCVFPRLGSAFGLGNSNGTGQQRPGQTQPEGRERRLVAVGTSPLGGFWRNAEWLAFTDGRARPVEPGTFPLVNGAVARVGRLRAHGNAIVAPLATEWMRVVMEVVPC